MALEDNLRDISNAIENLEARLDPNNDFGQSVGDELHSIDFNLGRIADALEKIANK